MSQHPYSEVSQHHPYYELPQHHPYHELSQHHPYYELSQHNPYFELSQHNLYFELSQHTPKTKMMGQMTNGKSKVNFCIESSCSARLVVDLLKSQASPD
ncbi:hypothetical protein Bpfe_004218 [Biomphalaria pfeifferi]|uniref:Uncharacterized protein n=1 Tax=Biomphalaria pfeifferi TaxID=112525 RepID=A0AAD8C555_BIOPF|nr:hypothetical protein Bpfe_004218 [Biomphalaria pfeifferi]